MCTNLVITRGGQSLVSDLTRNIPSFAPILLTGYWDKGTFVEKQIWCKLPTSYVHNNTTYVSSVPFNLVGKGMIRQESFEERFGQYKSLSKVLWECLVFADSMISYDRTRSITLTESLRNKAIKGYLVPIFEGHRGFVPFGQSMEVCVETIPVKNDQDEEVGRALHLVDFSHTKKVGLSTKTDRPFDISPREYMTLFFNSIMKVWNKPEYQTKKSSVESQE